MPDVRGFEELINDFEKDFDAIVTPRQRDPRQKIHLLGIILLIYVGLFVFVNVLVGFISEQSYIPIPPPDPAWGWFAWYQIFIFAIESIIPLGIAYALLRRGGLKVVLIAWVAFAFFFGALVDYSWSFVGGDFNWWLTGGGLTGDPRFWVHPFTWGPLPASGPMIWWLAVTRFIAAGLLFYIAYRVGKHHIALTSKLPTYRQTLLGQGDVVCFRATEVSGVDYDVCKPVNQLTKK